MTLKKVLSASAVFCGVALISTSAMAGPKSSIGTYSKCDSQLKGNKAEIASCKKCLESGAGFYNYDEPKKKWVCGMTSDMTISKPTTGYKPPPKPKKMPESANNYVTISAGKFKIGMRQGEEGGSEDKEYFDEATITISRSFMMKATEVTFAEWYFVRGDLPWSFGPDMEKGCGLECPVVGVTWRQVLEYLNDLSEQEKLEPCYDLSSKLAVWKGFDCTGYRLPTEAEWEYAARGGVKAARYGELDDIAWHSGNQTSGTGLQKGGLKQPNAYGLYDMLGNVWEWTWDYYEPGEKFTNGMVDPVMGGFKQVRTDGVDNRILRGGSANDSFVYVRAAHRFYNLSDSDGRFIGFRPVRTIPGSRIAPDSQTTPQPKKGASAPVEQDSSTPAKATNEKAADKKKGRGDKLRAVGKAAEKNLR